MAVYFEPSKMEARAQSYRLNEMNMSKAQADIDRTANLKQIAQGARRNTYDVETYDRGGPNKPTGTEYDPQAHIEGARQAGETKAAEGLERHLSQMGPEKRKQIEFRAEQGAIDAFNADTEDLWELLQERLAKEAEIAGEEFNPRTYGERQDVINEAKNIMQLTGANLKEREFTEQKRSKNITEERLQKSADEQERHNKAMEAKSRSGRQSKKTKADRQLELAGLISNDNATPEEIAEWDLLSKTDPLDIAIRDALKRSAKKDTGKSKKFDNVPLEAIKRLKDNPGMADDFESFYKLPAGSAKEILSD